MKFDGQAVILSYGARRTPHGVRGLKSGHCGRVERLKARRTPHGVRGLKCRLSAYSNPAECRTPHGVRGLKFLISDALKVDPHVAPHTGCVD